MQSRYEELINQPERIEAILQDGAERVRVVAIPVLNRVRAAVGLPTR